MNENDKMLWVDENLHTALKIKAAEEKTTMRGVLRRLLQND